MVWGSRTRLDDWKARAGALKRETHVLYLCSRHPRTPLHAKLFALLIVCYALSPIDLVPDFIPVLGYIDDLVLIPCGIVLLIRMVPKDVLEECRLKARSTPDTGPGRWAGAVIVAGIWGLGVYVTLRIAARAIKG
jgi:uncharacterized membrane protein YkvA (DUF1232 family)